MSTTLSGVKTDLEKGVQYIVNENGHRVLFSDLYSFLESYNKFNDGYDELKVLMKDTALKIKKVINDVDNEDIFSVIYEELKGVGKYSINSKNSYVKHSKKNDNKLIYKRHDGYEVDLTELVINCENLARLYHSFTMLSSYDHYRLEDMADYEKEIVDDYTIVGWTSKKTINKTDPTKNRYYNFVNIWRKRINVPNKVYEDFLDFDEKALTGYNGINDDETNIDIEIIAIPRMVKLVLNEI